MKKALPWWLTLFVIIEALPMFLGPVAAFSFPRMLAGPDAVEINQAAFIYAARNVAVGLGFIIALILKNKPMLFILIFIRLLTDLVDLPTILHFGLVTRTSLTISIFVFVYYIPAVFALRYLWRQMQGGNSGQQVVSG